MNFIQPFTWMFKSERFGKHLSLLLITAFLCIIIYFILGNLLSNSIYLKFIQHSIILTIILIFSGYFWCLTGNVIERTDDIVVDNIHNGVVKIRHIIELPKSNILRFLWRGIASIVATLTLFFPIICLYMKFVNDAHLIKNFWGLSQQQINFISYIVLLLLIILLPGLLWNYASKDSVFAMLDIKKAIFIMECYTKKYILNIVADIIFLTIQFYCIKFILSKIGIDIILNFTNNQFYTGTHSIFTIEPFTVVLIIINMILFIYTLFVLSFLLGTITPPNEY